MMQKRFVVNFLNREGRNMKICNAIFLLSFLWLPMCAMEESQKSFKEAQQRKDEIQKKGKALLRAAKRGTLEDITNALKDAGTDVVDWADSERMNALMHVIERDDREFPGTKHTADTTRLAIVRLLLNRRTNVNAVDSYGMTPLMIAIFRDRPEIVELLLAHERIDINRVDGDGRSALMMAVDNANIGGSAILEMLLDHMGRILDKNYDEINESFGPMIVNAVGAINWKNTMRSSWLIEIFQDFAKRYPKQLPGLETEIERVKKIHQRPGAFREQVREIRK